jgi:hypothetical protein
LVEGGEAAEHIEVAEVAVRRSDPGLDRAALITELLFEDTSCFPPQRGGTMAVLGQRSSVLISVCGVLPALRGVKQPSFAILIRAGIEGKASRRLSRTFGRRFKPLW